MLSSKPFCSEESVQPAIGEKGQTRHTIFLFSNGTSDHILSVAIFWAECLFLQCHLQFFLLIASVLPNLFQNFNSFYRRPKQKHCCAFLFDSSLQSLKQNTSDPVGSTWKFLNSAICVCCLWAHSQLTRQLVISWEGAVGVGRGTWK